MSNLDCNDIIQHIYVSLAIGEQALKLDTDKDQSKADATKLERSNSVKSMILAYNAKENNALCFKPRTTKGNKNLEKRLTPQEEKNLKLLENLHSQIDPSIPHDQLTSEQKYILQLKDVYQSTKLKPFINKPKDSVAISRPLLTSVMSNPKLREIRNNPDLFDLELIRFGSVKVSRQLSIPHERSRKSRLSWSQRSKSLDLIPPPTPTLGQYYTYEDLSDSFIDVIKLPPKQNCDDIIAPPPEYDEDLEKIDIGDKLDSKRPSSEINDADLELIAAAQSRYLKTEKSGDTKRPMSEINEDDLALIAAAQSKYLTERSGDSLDTNKTLPVYANYNQFLKAMIHENDTPTVLTVVKKPLPVPRVKDQLPLDYSHKFNAGCGDSFTNGDERFSKLSAKYSDISKDRASEVKIIYGEHEHLV